MRGAPGVWRLFTSCAAILKARCPNAKVLDPSCGEAVFLLVSGVYYPVSVMPHWMQAIAKISPATYALRGDRASIVDGMGLEWANVWPLLIIAIVAMPLGLAIFKRGERYAKKHGKLKRSG